jgi:SAM-dependent methyltransferase
MTSAAGASRDHGAVAGDLRCPRCSAPIRKAGEILICARCDARYPIEQGVLDFRVHDRVAQNPGLDISPRILASLSADNWSLTIRELVSDRDDVMEKVEDLTSAGRAAWKGFLDLSDGGKLLVLGCGYGNLVEHLAPHFDRVYAIDDDIEKLGFAQRRFTIFNDTDDVVSLAVNDPTKLPFPARSIDTIVAVSPVDAGMMAEARRLLRDGGQILVVANNRLNLALPKGWWDRWSNAASPIRLLTRTIGLAAVWLRAQNGFQPLPGLRRAIRQAGFQERHLLGFSPDRHPPGDILPLKGPLAHRSSTVRSSLRSHALFLPAHGLTAGAGERHGASTYERLLEAVGHQLSASTAPIQIDRMIVTRKDKLIVLASRGEDQIVLRVPFGAAATAAERNNADMIKRVPDRSPRHLAEGTIDGVVYFVESMMSGVPAKESLVAGRREETLERIEGLLENLNPVSGLSPEPFEGARYRKLVDERLERLFEHVPDVLDHDQVREFFRSRLHGASLPFGLLHGDFSCSNIQFSDDGETGAIDWEAAAFDDLPILDAIGFLESVHRHLNPGHGMIDSFSALASGEFQSKADERFLLTRYDRLGIDRARHVGLVYLRWLRLVDYLLPYWLRFHPDGQQRYVHSLVETMLR